MPTFTALALDRLLEPGVSMSATESKLERSNSTPARAIGAIGEDSGAVTTSYRKPWIPLAPPAHPKVARRSSPSSRTTTDEKEKASWPKISPALYSTPESTPLPDSPPSFSNSPYLINHKRRGPRLQKNSSEANVSKEKAVDEKAPSASHSSEADVQKDLSSSLDDVDVATRLDPAGEKKTNVLLAEMIENGAINKLSGEPKDLRRATSADKETEIEDFFDLLDSMSVTSNADGEDNSVELCAKSGVFYDAWEELSSEGGRQILSSMHDLEAELREMRLSFLMEIEKRKLAEDAMKNMQTLWHRLREDLKAVGLILPAELSATAQDEETNADFTEDICQQIFVTRFVSESIGRGTARAECEEELEAQLEWKNFEIARLCDRLHYYETMNREMSQRNQEAIELARRDRQRRNKMQKWFWGSVATAVTLGSAALAWSYFPSAKGLSSHQHNTSEPDSSTDESNQN